MSMLRALVFNAGFYLWTVLFGMLGLPLLLGPWRLIMRFSEIWTAVTLAWLRLAVGLDHEFRGLQNLPSGPAVVALKHQSAWDTLILNRLLRDPAIVCKRELLLIPLFGWYAWRAGMIAIDRKAGAGALRRMVSEARRAASLGRPVAIFPEGTRGPVGGKLPYQPGVGALYAQLGVPLVPVALNSGLYWGRRAFMKYPGRIILEVLPPIEPGLERRRAMALVEERIECATARLLAESGSPRPAVDNSVENTLPNRR